MNALDMRPLASGELLDRSFALYRRYPWLFIGIMAVPSVLSLVIGVFFVLVVAMQQIDPTADPDQLLPVLIALMGGVVVFLVVYWIVYMAALGATTMAVSELYRGRVPTIAGSYQRVRGLMGRLIMLALLTVLRIGGVGLGIVAVTAALAAITWFIPVLMALIVMIGLLASFVVTSYLTLRYAVVVPAIVLEQVTAAEAIRRSVFLTRGYLGRVSLLLLCVFVVAYASLLVFQMPFSVAAALAGQGTTASLVFTLLGSVSSTIGGTITGPLMIIGFAVLYYDLRIRKEALDLDMMISALDAGGADDVPLSAPVAQALPD